MTDPELYMKAARGAAITCRDCRKSPNCLGCPLEKYRRNGFDPVEYGAEMTRGHLFALCELCAEDESKCRECPPNGSKKPYGGFKRW